MGKQVKPSKSGTKRVRDIIESQVGSAARTLSDCKGRLARKSVHKIRTDLKKARALLRLLRESLGRKSYREENSRLRDAGKLFTQVRDATVLSQTLGKLEAHYRDKFDKGALHHLKSAIRKENRQLRSQVLTDPGSLAKIEKRLQSSKKKIQDWAITPHGWSKLGLGLQRTFKSSRLAFKEARQRQTPSSLHEWRKQAKHLRYQVEVLEPIWSRSLQELVKEMHELTKHLGDDHDLQMLKKKLKQNPNWVGGKKSLKNTLFLIEKRQKKLRQKAFALGNRLFSESPSLFSKRLGNYWKLWRAEGPHAPDF